MMGFVALLLENLKACKTLKISNFNKVKGLTDAN
jgi:hypothetical protein